MYSDIKFKPGRCAVRLWVYQFLASIILAIVLYIFCDFLTLLPNILKDCCNPTAVIIGSMYFGQWMEKRFPKVLDDKKINKIALRSSLISYLVISVIAIVSFIDYSFSYKSVDSIYFIALFLFSLLILLLLYFFTVFSIKLGLKTERKSLEDLR